MNQYKETIQKKVTINGEKKSVSFHWCWNGETRETSDKRYSSICENDVVFVIDGVNYNGIMRRITQSRGGWQTPTEAWWYKGNRYTSEKKMIEALLS